MRLLPAALLALALTGCAVETSNEPGSSATEGGSGGAGGGSDAGADVTVNSCERGEFGQVTAGLSITNSTDAAKSYLVTVSADGPDGARVAELNAASNSVQPGQTAMVDALGAATDPPEGLTCTVVSVNRF
jgi:hypothetical protein